ncbi:class I SAM-dependent methyltransferase [Anaerolentibacter hominis]|uniref:class I SAM-dependent DNA methyltransferase n=1 Tax=Anaerolentibacter hominis TaxID=3079009 RepID=UPI0031B85877
MNEYTSFAEVYDLFMDNVPYQEWGKYLAGLLRQYGVRDGLVAELGCGTGSMTMELAAAGFDMIGIDNSEEMLAIARGKMGEGDSILYLLQDMRSFELYGTVNAFVSVCDSLNYIIDESDLLSVFRLVNNYLERDGIFIFDLNTPYKYEEMLGEKTFAENREDSSFIWENYYDREDKINEYDLTLFIREGELFRKYEEVHCQRAWELDEVRDLLGRAGMHFVRAYDAFTSEEPNDSSERIYVVAREGRQAGKTYNDQNLDGN